MGIGHRKRALVFHFASAKDRDRRVAAPCGMGGTNRGGDNCVRALAARERKAAERRYCGRKKSRRRSGRDARPEKRAASRDRWDRRKRESPAGRFFGRTSGPRDFFGDGAQTRRRSSRICNRALAKFRSNLRRRFRAKILKSA